jgi:hypothetical protein
MTKGNRQRAMSAHGMSHDRLPVAVCGKMLRDQFWQLLSHIAPHPIVSGERRLRRINIEARAQSEIIGVAGIAWHAFAARAGVGSNEDQAVFGTSIPELAFLGHIGVRAGQA